jgi:hypothetical protein
MKASILDLRRRMRDVLRALERNEPVTILHRGREKGILLPADARKPPTIAVSSHASFGMWKDREDLKDVDSHVRSLRKGRADAV